MDAFHISGAKCAVGAKIQDYIAALTWQTAPVPAHSQGQVAFVLAVGFGNGSPLPQPSGRWDIYVEGRLAVSVRVVKHSQLWRSDECSFAFAANGAYSLG